MMMLAFHFVIIANKNGCKHLSQSRHLKLVTCAANIPADHSFFCSILIKVVKVQKRPRRNECTCKEIERIQSKKLVQVRPGL